MATTNASRSPVSANSCNSFTSRRSKSREQSNHMDFQGRRVWITGASSGIGEALALAFHGAGAKLILSARREDELKRVQSACGGEPGTLFLPMDVTDAEELPKKTQLALSMFGGIDVLVLNAGITQRSRTRE